MNTSYHYPAGIHAFKAGQFVNTSDGFAGFIYSVVGENYEVAIGDHDEDRRCSTNDLTHWTPIDGARVVEAGNENSPVGIVVEAGDETSQVVWAGLLNQVSFVNSCLEPAFD